MNASSSLGLNHVPGINVDPEARVSCTDLVCSNGSTNFLDVNEAQTFTTMQNSLNGLDISTHVVGLEEEALTLVIGLELKASDNGPRIAVCCTKAITSLMQFNIS